MSSDAPTALTRDFGGEFKFIQRLIDKQLDQRGLTNAHEGASLGGDILFAGWNPRDFVLFNLHILYQGSGKGAGDKYEVLGRCLTQALDMAEFLQRNLQLRLQRILADAYSCGSVSLSKAEAREFVEKFCRFRLPRRLPEQQAPEKESFFFAYPALLEVLGPGFNKVNKAVTKMSAAFKAIDWCIESLPGASQAALKRGRDEIADMLLRSRKPESAALKLLSRALGISESTLRRRLREK